MPSWAKATIDLWTYAIRVSEGFLFRRVKKGGNIIGTKMTEQAIYNIDVTYKEKLEKQGIAPYNLRRTLPSSRPNSGRRLI